ncbi:MAG: ABC transporter permease [Lachnospiraceae bacterium]|nr:ABC transporter permease [Lachnospiraceae bacterium]
MRMTKLAFLNFKSSAKNFLWLIVSLAFTVMIFLNFVNLTYSDALAEVGEHNKEYMDIIIRVLCFILGVFSFFYIWYATNVFLTRRKKEIGIYIFMGLSGEKIGKMYMIESALTGITALVLGLLFGTLATGLFQMILMAALDMEMIIDFHVKLMPIVITGIVYAVIYSIFVWKGYWNIARSSVLDMISAAKRNEYVRQNAILLFLKTILGCGVLGSGYYIAVKDAGQEMLGNVMAAVVLVTIGVYLLFGGLIPLIFQKLAAHKNFLYQKQRNLWINQMIFRMKKNYRTYAMASVLALSAVTALATGFAMKTRYDNIISFENTYTFQFLTNQESIGEQAAAIMGDSILYQGRVPIVQLKAEEGDSGWGRSGYLMVSWSGLRELAAAAGLEFDLEEPVENEVISLENMPLMSLITNGERGTRIIGGRSYEQIMTTRVPYFGYLQEQMSIYAVSDTEYEQLASDGDVLYTFHYRISDPADYEQIKEALNVLISNTEENFTARVALDPNHNDIGWIKALYPFCIFLFMVFAMASGCIMLMKVINDSVEEKPRYEVLGKLGIDRKILRRSVACELAAAYGLSFLVMSVSSYFSVLALAKTMFTNLISVNIVSVLVIFAIFIVFYLCSLTAYQKTAGI